MAEAARSGERIPAADSFPAGGARRLLILGGIALILAGMIFGTIFAVFVLHQNANTIGAQLLAATQAVAAGDAEAVRENFRRIGGTLEDSGTKKDTHAHIIKFGYLALLLALLQPNVALSAPARKRLAVLFLVGATTLPVAVFLIRYVGLAYSPLPSIGWASIAADLSGLLVIIACAGMLYGLARHGRGHHASERPAEPLAGRNATTRALLVGGTVLILAGLVHGAYYAAVYLYDHEARDSALLVRMVETAASGDARSAAGAVNDYGFLQGRRAVHIAAHAHIIEFGVLALLLAFIQPFVYLSETWKRRWVALLLTGSVVLPVFVLLELQLGLAAGGIADVGGLLVIIALSGMLVGILRYTGKLDAMKE